MHHHTQPDPLATESFPTDPSGLPEAGRPQLLELGPDDTLELHVGPVAKRLGDITVRMLGYNGSIPGPTLKGTVASGPKAPTRDSEVEALPVRTAVRSARSDQS
jgi:hypothetical protein